MLVDAASLYFRAFHGIPRRIVGPHGRPVNAIRGYLDFLAFLIEERRPARLVSCLDHDWRPAFRVTAIPSYKSHRLAPDGGEDVPPELQHQVPVLLQVLTALGLCSVGAAGFEADDVIGTLAEQSQTRTDVVTGDRDLFQVVADQRGVAVLYTAKGVRKYQVLDEAAVRDRYGVPPDRYADFAALRGDPSDGLPGVAGIGEKTAASLIGMFGSLPELLRALDDGVDVPRRRVLEGARDYLDVAMTVVRVRTDVPLPSLDTAIPAAPRDPESVVALSDEHGLDAPLGRLLAAMAQR